MEAWTNDLLNFLLSDRTDIILEQFLRVEITVPLPIRSPQINPDVYLNISSFQKQTENSVFTIGKLGDFRVQQAILSFLTKMSSY